MPKIFRIRFIPNETIDISSDKILFMDDHYLITSWKPIRPRADIESGISCIFLDEGWKVSAVKDSEGNIRYWYCDIIDVRHDENEDTIYLYDLLIDIIIMNDGSIEVRDLDELAEAYEKDLITEEQLSMSLKRSNNLLQLIYKEDIPSIVSEIISKYADGECMKK